MTLGRHIFLSPSAARSIAARTEPGARLIAHEIHHVGQFRREGFLGFVMRYVAAYARGRFRGLTHAASYGQIPFEIEARDAEETAMWKAGLSLDARPRRASHPGSSGRRPVADAGFLPGESEADEPRRES